MANIEAMDNAAPDAAPDAVGEKTPDAAIAPAPLTKSSGAIPAAQAAPGLTHWQRIQRGLLIMFCALVCAVLLAPLALALVAALAALAADGLAALTIGRLVAQGAIVQAGNAMNLLSVASRVGFLAVGYLGLFCALMTLLAGLLGRGQGRLFIIPGVLLTASGLVLVGAGVALCWPLLAGLLTLLAAPSAAALAVALYLALDTVALATLLADTRETRRRWLRRRRQRQHAHD